VTIKKVQAVLVTVLLVAVTVRVLWFVVEPLLPYVLVGLVLVTIFGFMFYRVWR
jgi:hypothetical protein